MYQEFAYQVPAAPQTFSERVREMFSFDGRIGRQSYWMRSLLLWGIYIVAVILFAVAGDAGSASIPLILLGAATYLACFFGSLATTAKRLHDRGRSAWFMLISLIPFVGLWVIVEVGFLAGNPTENEYGSPE